jgi:GGDEF domain-containing protein
LSSLPPKTQGQAVAELRPDLLQLLQAHTFVCGMLVDREQQVVLAVGHTAEDEFLIQLAQHLRTHIRPG